jgi:hypothetical protein
MKGKGIADILKAAKRMLGPVAKQVTKKAVKEVLIPYLFDGGGLKLAGGSRHTGGALKLAGQGSNNPWIAHVRKVAKDQGLKYNDALKVASQSYVKLSDR